MQRRRVERSHKHFSWVFQNGNPSSRDHAQSVVNCVYFIPWRRLSYSGIEGNDQTTPPVYFIVCSGAQRPYSPRKRYEESIIIKWEWQTARKMEQVSRLKIYNFSMWYAIYYFKARANCLKRIGFIPGFIARVALKGIKCGNGNKKKSFE